MEYNDEKSLSIAEYEIMAKAYADALRKKGFKIIDASVPDKRLVDSLFENLYKIKNLLFCLGGFLGTSQFYSLNERQLDKFKIIFSDEVVRPVHQTTRDKTKCFLSFLSAELALIKQLIAIAEQTSFENEIKNMTTQRLALLSKILAL